MTNSWRFQLHSFLNAIVFFTRIPIPIPLECSNKHLGMSVVYLPLVGTIIGLIIGMFYALSSVILTHQLAILLSMALSVYLTGAIHEDGFADTCDGFGAGWNKEQILSIMKDSQLGTYGVLGLIFILLLKFFCLNHLPQGSIISSLIISHSLSRLIPVMIIYFGEYVSYNLDSKSKPLSQKITTTQLCCSLLFGLAPIIFLLPSKIVTSLFFCLILAAIFRNYFHRKIEGFTGDTLGAAQQLSEILIYLYFCSHFLN